MIFRRPLFAFFAVTIFLVQACISSGDNENLDENNIVGQFIKSDESCEEPAGLNSFFGVASQNDIQKTPYELFLADEFVVDNEVYRFYQDKLEAEFEQPRNVQYEFHAWFALRAVLSQALSEGAGERSEILLAMRDYVVNYAEKNRFSDNDYRTQKAEGFQWYDMGVGLRSLTLGALLRVFSCEEILNEEELDILHSFAIDHVEYLLSERFHSGHNNHGAFQSAGAIGLCSYYSVLPDCEALYSLSEQRLKAYFDLAIVGGVHTEHSTAYMVYMLDLLSAVIKVDGLTEGLKSYLYAQLESLSGQLQWFIAPDGSEVQIGDTDDKKFPVASLHKAPIEHVSGALWLASNGKEGAPSSDKFWLSKEAGYAAARDVESGEYVLFAAAYHSRTHKHADDGNIIWYTDSKPILIDAGKHGYFQKSEPGSVLRAEGFWYANPKRVYVESNRAHNVVEIDGISTNRRTAAAYGSAVAGGASNQHGAAVFEMLLDREEGVLQRRTVIHQEGRFILVVDDLESVRGDRNYKQWFQFAPRFSSVAEFDAGVEMHSTQGELVRITEHSGGDVQSAAFRGQERPKLQGWHSKEAGSFYPNYSISLSAFGAHAKLFTLIEYFDVANQASEQPMVSFSSRTAVTDVFKVVSSDGVSIEYELFRGDNYRIVSSVQ